MNFVRFLDEQCCGFEASLNAILNEQNPIAAPPSFIFEPKFRNNIEILCNEIFCRSFFWVACSTKTLFSVVACVLSPASLLFTGRIVPPTLAWKRFCKEARYLAADSFELIGVVVCSILLLPFTRKNCPLLLSAQAWIEKKVEWISGEKFLVSSIRETLDSAETRKELLFRVRRDIEMDNEEIKNWMDKSIDFDDIIRRMDVLRYRRICRNYDSIPSREELNKKLMEIAAIISDRIATVVIPKRKQTLFRLKSLCDQHEHELNHFSCDETESLETKLMHFERLEVEINKTIDQLHEIHDPEHVLRKEIERLNLEKERALSNALHDALSQIRFGTRGGTGIGDILKEVYQHFLFVSKKCSEIDCIYSYKNITQLDEAFSQTFVSDLIKKIDECRKLLDDQCLAWETRNAIPIDRPRALRIFDLTEAATPSEIRKAYRRLCLIHHPDKGGQPEIFETIHSAYEVLTKGL